MNEIQQTARRATLDDLPVLRGLWETARLPVFDLERRLTEFHVITRSDGVVNGAIGFRVAGWHGLLHSEAFYSEAGAAISRPLLWEHIQKLARGQGAARLWMVSPVADFWKDTGFRQASTVELPRLPVEFGPANRPWHTLPLRDDVVLEQVVEKEFARLREEGEARNASLRRQVTFWKIVGGLIALGFFAAAIWLLFAMVSSATGR